MGLVLISSVKYVTVQWTWAGYYFAGYPAKLNPDIWYFCSFFKIVFLTKQMMHYFSFSGSFQLDPTEPAALHYTYSNFINIRYLAVNPVRHMRYTYSKLACIFWPHPVGGGLCLMLWGHGHYHRPTCSTRPSQGSLQEDHSGDGHQGWSQKAVWWIRNYLFRIRLQLFGVPDPHPTHPCYLVIFGI